MMRTVFFVLIMMCSVSWADWDFTTRSSDGLFTIYHDKSTIRRNGVRAKMWRIDDYAVAQTNSSGQEYKSVKVLYAYNCREETDAIISIIHYSGSMGQGSAVWSFTVKEEKWQWDPIAPNSVGEMAWKVACGKK